MKRILITGGTGFIGRNIIPALSREYEVYAPTRAQLNMLDETAVMECLKTGSFDTVIHCATQNATRNAKEPADLVLGRTLKMFFNLIRGDKYFSKMIYFGSGAEFDKSRDIVSVREEQSGEKIPDDMYGLAKYTMNEIARRSDKYYNLRLFGCYGPYEDWEIRFISNAVCKALYGLPVTMKQNVVFDYMYIEDLIPIVNWFVESTPKYHDYNICSGTKVDLITIVKLIEKVTKRSLNLNVKSEGLNKEYTALNERLLSEIKDISFTPLEEGIKKLVEFYSQRLDTIDREKLFMDK